MIQRPQVIQGDALTALRGLPDASAQACVTSPPYYALRDYGMDAQIGLEDTPEAYIQRLVDVFREVRRVLRDDGTLWVNIGDSYASGGRGGGGSFMDERKAWSGRESLTGWRTPPRGLKRKDLIGIPWMLAFALRADGWYLRQDIIWCLSGGAWVYARTQKGDMPVMVKDLVRLNPATVQLWNGEKWTQVLGWGPSTDTTERLELVLRSGERIGCTGGHLWPTQRGNVAARDLVLGDVIATCKLPEPTNAMRPGYLTDDALWLAGLYLAEGSQNRSARQLSLCADELPWLPRIEAVARYYGGSCTHTLTGNTLNVRLYGSVLHAVIDTYIAGDAAIDKHLTNAAWRLPDSALHHVIQGYLDGDGHHDQTSNRWRLGFSRNYNLERDLRTAAARLDATLTLKPVRAAYQHGERPSFRGEWRWERSGHWNEKDRGEVMEIRASRARQFWDIAVEDEPHLFALASGVLTHNCKPNPMPESVTDRCTKAHEYVFLLSKSPRYAMNPEGLRESAVGAQHRPRAQYERAQELAQQHGLTAEHIAAIRAVGLSDAGKAQVTQTGAGQNDARVQTLADEAKVALGGYYREFLSSDTRNRRSVWSIVTKPFSEAHFAVMPVELAETCILASTRPGDTVLDPFMGAYTTAYAALLHGRHAVGTELNPEYIAIGERRIAPFFDFPLFQEASA